MEEKSVDCPPFFRIRVQGVLQEHIELLLDPREHQMVFVCYLCADGFSFRFLEGKFATRGHLVQYHSEAPNIGSLIQLFTLQNLWRQIMLIGHFLAAGVSKAGNLGYLTKDAATLLILEEDVTSVQLPVEHAHVMDFLEAQRHVHKQFIALDFWHGSALLQLVEQVFALAILEDGTGSIFALEAVADAYDVREVYRNQSLRLLVYVNVDVIVLLKLNHAVRVV